MLHTARFLIPALAALLPGCDVLELPRNCTASVEPAIIVEIYDAVTHAAIAGSASGYIRDGDFTDVLKPAEFLAPPPGMMYARRAGDERPGRYDVFVSHAGYAPWSALGIRARSGECHVQTQRLRADLEPLAGSPHP